MSSGCFGEMSCLAVDHPISCKARLSVDRYYSKELFYWMVTGEIRGLWIGDSIQFFTVPIFGSESRTATLLNSRDPLFRCNINDDRSLFMETLFPLLAAGFVSLFVCFDASATGCSQLEASVVLSCCWRASGCRSCLPVQEVVAVFARYTPILESAVEAGWLCGFLPPQPRWVVALSLRSVSVVPWKAGAAEVA